MSLGRRLSIFVYHRRRTVATNRLNRDYMDGGRFTFKYDISQLYMRDFFLQVWVSKLVNELWQ
jgi:hypothetical protein